MGTPGSTHERANSDFESNVSSFNSNHGGNGQKRGITRTSTTNLQKRLANMPKQDPKNDPNRRVLLNADLAKCKRPSLDRAPSNWKSLASNRDQEKTTDLFSSAVGRFLWPSHTSRHSAHPHHNPRMSADLDRESARRNNEDPSSRRRRSSNASVGDSRCSVRTKPQNLFYVAADAEDAEVTVMQNEYRDAQWVPQSYAELMETNDMRERLLDDARKYSPISSVFHLNKIPQTVVWRMMTFPLVWIIVSVYLSLALLTRNAIIHLGEWADFSELTYDGADMLITFMVVFYLGYCYDRHFEIYHLCTQSKSTIANLCSAGRVCLPETARRKLFVHLNLMHASAYCALTPIYNWDNFFSTFSALHHIEVPNHEEIFHDVDTSGGTHYNMCCVWAQGVLHSSLQAGQLHPEAFRGMLDDLLKLRQCFATIFALQYQVIPFAYSHLVSMSCALYLVGLAVIKAVQFQPDSPILSGAVLPCLSLFIAIISTVGLIEVGQVIADPWGNDPEDFAVPRFLHATAKLTRYVTEDCINDPLSEESKVQIGAPSLNFVPLEGQRRLRRNHGHNNRRHTLDEELKESLRQRLTRNLFATGIPAPVSRDGPPAGTPRKMGRSRSIEEPGSFLSRAPDRSLGRSTGLSSCNAPIDDLDRSNDGMDC